MKILIDCRSASKPYTGIGMYVVGLLSQLKNTKFQYILLSYDQFEAANLNGVQFEYLRMKKRNKHIENQIIVPYLAYTKNVDLLHITHHDAFPIFYFKKTILSVMDIFWIDHENNSSTLFKFLYYSISRIAFKRASKLITISNSTKQSIQNKMGIRPNKVKSILISCHSEFKRSTNKKIGYLDKLEPYVLYNGSSAKRKNIGILSKIDDHLKEMGISVNFLLLTKKSGKNDSELNAFLNKKNFIIDDNYYSIKDLNEFYSRSLAFIFPSKYEGFGLPVLEAIKCGTIPIISNSTSLPEIVLGDTDFIVEADDYKAFAKKLEKIITDINYNKILKRKLAKISMHFNWNITSSKTEELYEV